MKRNATSEWGWKRSKSITSNTKLITRFIDFEKSEPIGKKRKKKKDNKIYKIWDVLRLSARYLYSPNIEDKWKWQFKPQEEGLSSKIREFSMMWWRSYPVDIIVSEVNVKDKHVTYYWDYAWFPIAFDNRFSNIKYIWYVNNESEESNWDIGQETELESME